MIIIHYKEDFHLLLSRNLANSLISHQQNDLLKYIINNNLQIILYPILFLFY